MRKIYLLMFAILFISMASAASPSFYVPQNEDFDLKFSCSLDGGICDATVGCNITINYPNSSIMIDNENTTNLNNGYFSFKLNATLNQTTPKGEYFSLITCTNTTLSDTDTFIYEVNPTGIRPSESRTQTITRSMYFLFVIGILGFIGFLFSNAKPPVKWTFFLVSIMFLLSALNILFVGIQDEIVNPKLESFFDVLTASSYILFWFAFGLIAIIWALTIIQTSIMRKKLKDSDKYVEF